MASSTECNVCKAGFTKTGERCPKLLPCSHTVCLWCLPQLPGLTKRCPECREILKVPSEGMKGFPTNRYVLEILDLLKDNQQQNADFCGSGMKEEEESILCEHHQKPCVMFCLEMECWHLLCPKCPLHQHQEHNLVGLAECVKDSDGLNKMKEKASEELSLLHKYELNMRESICFASKESDEAIKAINKKATELKTAIDEAVNEMQRNIERSLAEQVGRLTEVLQNIQVKFRSGNNLKNDIEYRPRNCMPEAIQHVSKLKQRLLDFQKSSKEERNKRVGFSLFNFKPIQSQDSGTNPLGELVSSIHLI